jgi:hypothetical protein
MKRKGNKDKIFATERKKNLQHVEQETETRATEPAAE